MHIQYDPAISAIVSHTHPLSHFIWSLYPMTIAMILNIWQLLLVLAIRGMIGMIYLVWDDVLIVTWVFIEGPHYLVDRHLCRILAWFRRRGIRDIVVWVVL